MITDSYKCGPAVLTDTWNFPEYNTFSIAKLKGRKRPSSLHTSFQIKARTAQIHASALKQVSTDFIDSDVFQVSRGTL